MGATFQVDLTQLGAGGNAFGMQCLGCGVEGAGEGGDSLAWRQQLGPVEPAWRIWEGAWSHPVREV